MKSILILLIILFYPLAGNGSAPEGVAADAPVTGFIDITVESNVNKVLFSYSLSRENITDEHGGTNESSVITVPVKDFRCNNKMAYRDFLTLLKADQFPEIKIGIPGNISGQLHSDHATVIHNVTVTIAGVSNKYDITCTPDAKGGIIIGTLKLGLNELNIEPPEKYFGMVKIKNEVVVKFGLGTQNSTFARK